MAGDEDKDVVEDVPAASSAKSDKKKKKKRKRKKKAKADADPLAALSAEDRATVEKLSASFDREMAKFLVNLKDERAVFKKKQKGIDTYLLHKEGHDIVIVKGVGKVRGDPEEIARWMVENHEESMRRLDDMYIDGRVVVDHTEHLVMTVYGLFKMPFPLWKRDFVWSAGSKAVRYNDKECWACLGWSEPHDDCPEVDGVVRGTIEGSGYLFEPLGDGTCECTYLVAVDPKGWIPVMAINLIAADQALNVARLDTEWIKIKAEMAAADAADE